MLDLNEIPSDLYEMIEEGEHCLANYSNKFEKAMMDNDLMTYGTARRSHRIMTDKCINLGYWETIFILTGLTKEEVLEKREEEAKEARIKKMFETAEIYGYTIIKD